MNNQKSARQSPECGAAFRVVGTGLDLAGISSALGTSPSHVHREGEQGPLGQAFPLDMWSLESPLPPTESLDAHVKWLKDALLPHRAFISSLQKQATLDIYCNAMLFREQSSLEFSPDALRLFTELNVPLAVSLLLLPENDVHSA